MRGSCESCSVPLQLQTHGVEDVQAEEVEGVGVGSGLDKRQQRGNDGAHHDNARERGPASDGEKEGCKE